MVVSEWGATVTRLHGTSAALRGAMTAGQARIAIFVAEFDDGST